MKISTCCGSPAWFDSDICSRCKEHTDFEEEVTEDAIIKVVEENSDVVKKQMEDCSKKRNHYDSGD